MDPCTAALDYLAAVTGSLPEARPLPHSALASLPAGLAQSYALDELQLFGRTVLLASPKDETQAGLAGLARDREQLAAALGRPVVLVLPWLRADQRQRLLQRQVPFMVPGRQMFLPMLLVDLREAFPAPRRPPAAYMSWVAQVLVLRQLLRDDVAGRPLARVAALLRYTPMAITLAAAELVRLKLCRLVATGRTKTLEFAPEGLWPQALPYLRSPVKNRLLLERLDAPGEPPPLCAGREALAAYLGQELDAAVPESLALPQRELGRLLAAGQCRACSLEEDARVIVEGWAYRPAVLTPEWAVDPLSLYLSLRDDPDAHVQRELGRLTAPFA